MALLNERLRERELTGATIDRREAGAMGQALREARALGYGDTGQIDAGLIGSGPNAGVLGRERRQQALQQGATFATGRVDQIRNQLLQAELTNEAAIDNLNMGKMEVNSQYTQGRNAITQGFQDAATYIGTQGFLGALEAKQAAGGMTAEARASKAMADAGTLRISPMAPQQINTAPQAPLELPYTDPMNSGPGAMARRKQNTMNPYNLGHAGGNPGQYSFFNFLPRF